MMEDVVKDMDNVEGSEKLPEIEDVLRDGLLRSG